MKTENLLECERRSLEKMERYFSFPNFFKKPALIFTVILMVGILGIGFFSIGDDNQFIETFKFAAKKLVLVLMLIAALSREKTEDEMIAKIRGQAYRAAFIAGVLYTLIQPYINYFVAALVRPEKAIFNELSTFVILWFMLVVYLATFHLLKRTS